MHVAIIDDGINPGVFAHVPSLLHDVEVTEDLQVLPRTQPGDTISHGTTCAAILCKYADHVQLSSIKILGSDGRGNREHLVCALKWCLDKHILLVHMSIGSTQGEDLEPIAEAVRELQQIGGVIVASWSNADKFTVPAGLPGVLSVKTNDEKDKRSYFINPLPYLDAGLVACSQHTLRFSNGSEYLTLQSNSYASPIVTAKAHNLLSRNPQLGLRQLREMIYISAANGKECAWQWDHVFNASGGGHCEFAKAGWILDLRILESAAKEALANKPPAAELTVPVIVISGEDALRIDVAKNLSEEMSKYGHYAKFVHETITDGQNAAEYLPQGVDILTFLSIIAHKFILSAVVLITSRFYPAWDVLIDVSTDGYHLRTEEGGDFCYNLSAREEMFEYILRALQPD